MPLSLRKPLSNDPLYAIAEFERQNILERQREGIAIAKKKGKYKGGKEKKIDEDTFQKGYAEYSRRMISKKKLAELLGISRPTLNKLLKERGLA
jgi:DNA invertase Pin-like site-specific DNA recombinase